MERIPKRCTDPFRLERLLSEEGAEADVYTSCLADDCSYVTRVVRSATVDDVEREKRLAMAASSIGLGPTVSVARECDGLGIFVIDRLDVDLIGIEENDDLLLPGNVKLIHDEIERLKQVARFQRFLHGDLHPGNVMFRLNEDKTMIDRAYLIDFSHSKIAVDEGEVDDEWDELQRTMTFDLPRLSSLLGYQRQRPVIRR